MFGLWIPGKAREAGCQPRLEVRLVCLLLCGLYRFISVFKGWIPSFFLVSLEVFQQLPKKK